MAENKCGKSIKVLRTVGGEFNLVDFGEICRIEGIVHEVTVP